MPLTPLQQSVLNAVDDAEAIAAFRRCVAIPSVTGDEQPFARFLVSELAECGVDELDSDEAAPGRPLVWSITRGMTPGPPLLIVGHTDTVSADTWAQSWQGTEREHPYSGAILDGALWGRGAGDVKAGIAATLVALRTLSRLGLRPQRDVITAWVPDEESGEPQLGRSLGMHRLCEHIAIGRIPKPGFAVYVEPTRLQIYAAQIGFVIATVTVTGKSAYFARPHEGIDALRTGNRVISELLALSDKMSSRGKHPLLDIPVLVIYSVQAGGNITVPGTCEISLIRTVMPPSETLSDAASEILRAVDRAMSGSPCQVDVTFPAGRDHELGGLPAETDSRSAPVTALRQAIRAVSPSSDIIAGAPYWSEMSMLAARDIPSVYWSPGDISNCHTDAEHVDIAEFLSGVKTLALFLADYCAYEDV
jgi:acetylornithine deacetylase